MKWFRVGLLCLAVLFALVGWLLVGVFIEARECRRGNLEKCVLMAPMVQRRLELISKVVPLEVIVESERALSKSQPLLEESDYWLGKEEERNYVVLLLNDRELRTFGGFMGSYAVITINKGVYTIRFEDIYVPDGQIDGYVAPPEPLQRAFQSGTHRLPNADWSPDFPRSAAAIRWFFDKGGEVRPDVLLTVNISTVEKIMEIIGEVKIPEYDLTLTHQNFYKWLEDNTEIDFFPGSTQKRDALTATGRAMVKKLEGLGWKDKFKVVMLLFEDLENKNIVVNASDEQVQTKLVNNGWSGSYSPIPCPGENCQAISTGLVEMNLGVNKANCCVERVIKHTFARTAGRFVHLIEVEILNNSPFERAVKPDFYGGNYLSYLRFYIPEVAENLQVSAMPTVTGDLGLWPQPYDQDQDELDIEQVYGFTEIGLFNTTRAGTSSWVRVMYEIVDDGGKVYFSILKQPGLREVPVVLDLLGEKRQMTLTDDYSVWLEE